MAELEILAIGRLKKDAEAHLEKRYLDRIEKMGASLGFKKASIREFPESNKDTGLLRKAEEAETLKTKLKSGTFLFLLDEQGKTPSSREFANLINDEMQAGSNHFSFAIGGPDGHGDEIKALANTKLSLSKMTLPHGLARIVLMEQIYRALTIWSGHPYHRD